MASSNTTTRAKQQRQQLLGDRTKHIKYQSSQKSTAPAGFLPSLRSPEFTAPDRPASQSQWKYRSEPGFLLDLAAGAAPSSQIKRPICRSTRSRCVSSPSHRTRTETSPARARVEAAADAGAKLVVLPEIWSCPYAMETLPSYAEDIDDGESPSILMLSEVAAARKITIVGGSIPEKASGKMFNTCCVIGTDGQILAKHRKLHLFEIDIPGDITLKESDTFTGGQEATIVDTNVGRIGIGICHDIRFPELAMLYRSKGAHLICYPSAFNMSTGELLWDLMQKSRAVDNQPFVATCSPARDPNANSDYMIWGHSSLIGPFGEVIAAAGHEEATVIGEIDFSKIQSTRENLPLEMQRRGDLYRLVDVSGQ